MNWTDLHPLIQEAGRTTLAVGFLALLVLTIRKPFARRFGAKAAYALWLLPMVRFAMPPLPANWSLTGWLGMATTAQPKIVETSHYIEPAEGPVALISNWRDAPLPMIEAPIAHTPTTSLLDAVLAQAPLILVSVWLAGVALWLGRSFYQQRQFLQLIRDDSEPASAAIHNQTKLIARRLGLKRLPDIRESLLCSGPLVTGLVRPVVLLPMWFEEDYTADEQCDALTHELTHLRRRDLWAFQAARLVAATQWFNPLAYMALNAFRTDQESACDADVLAQDQISPAAYGRTLVKAARLARPSDRRIAAASLTLAHPIKERLIMMQHPTPTLRSRLMGTALIATIGAAAIFATASCTSAAIAEEADSQTFVFSSDHGGSDDRQMVLLSDPFAKLHPKLSAIGDVDFGDMHMDLDIELEGLDVELSLLMEELGNMEGLEEMSALGEMLSLEMTGEDGHNVFIMKSGESSEDFDVRIEAWAEKFEEQAEVFEERAEEWAERYEERAEELAERSEALAEARSVKVIRRADAMAAAHEAKAEAWALKFEESFGEDFEAEMEAAGEAVESLADQCDARSETASTPEIVSAVDAKTGETYRALCVNGDRDTLKADSLADWVQGRSDLSDAEKTSFMDNRMHQRTIKITVGEFEHDVDEVHEAHDTDGDHRVIVRRAHRVERPEAPDAPEAPAAPELDGGGEQ